MKPFVTSLILAALAGSMGATSLAPRHDAPLRLKPQAKVALLQASPVTSTSDYAPQPLRSPGLASEVLHEDFDPVPAGDFGEFGEPTTCLASHYFEPGRYINPAYTPNSGTWEGDYVYAGHEAHTVLLQAFNPSGGASLRTPLGDYSGKLTVTVRARWSMTFWPKGDGTYWNTYSSTFAIYMLKGGFNSFEMANCPEVTSGVTVRLYPSDGWMEYTFEVTNPDPDPDGNMVIMTPDAVEIDCVKITDDPSYLTAPNGCRSYGFTRDGFSISWNKTRHTPFYYIDLWKKNYTADKGLDKTYDFNDGKLPEGTACDTCQFVDVNDGKAVALPDTVWFETEDYGEKVACMEMQIMWKQKNDPSGQIVIEAFGDNGWERLWSYYTQSLIPNTFYIAELEEEKIAGKYSRFRVRSENIGKRNQLIIDNVRVQSNRPYELERVWGPKGPKNGLDDNDGYCYYDFTDMVDVTSYTFSGLDPEADYLYRVKGMRMGQFSYGEKLEAVGLVTPELAETTVDPDGSYTMRWQDVPKAQAYLLTSYKSQKVEEDTEDFALLSEAFDGCDGAEDLYDMTELGNNSSYTFLDKYTDNPGWQGYRTIVGDNMLGSNGGKLVTPPLASNENRESPVMYLTAIGEPGDYLMVELPKSGISGNAAFRNDGMLSVKLSFDNFETGDMMTFSSYSGKPFALSSLDFDQNLLEGDVALTWDAQKQVGTGVQQYTFDGLDPDYTYACRMQAAYVHERHDYYSDSTPLTFIDLVNGESYIVIPANQSGITVQEIESTDIHEVARYTIDGSIALPGQKGLMIVKMSDGSARKVLVK